jgi:hypothetical protein
VNGHQDRPSDGHEADVMVITESNRILAIAPRDLLPADSERMKNCVGDGRARTQIHQICMSDRLRRYPHS